MKAAWVLSAQAVALLWAGFWTFFFVAESWSWHTPMGITSLWISLGVLFIFLALLPWCWELAGGLLLLVTGLSAGVAYGIWSPSRLSAVTRVLTTVILAGPPIIAGALLTMHSCKVGGPRTGIAHGR